MEVLRYDLLNYLIDEYNYQDYLEIGVGQGDCLRAVKAKNKDAVENGLEGITPPEVTHRMSSDEFFEQNTKKYDLIFIDGLHEKYQVIKDIDNSLRALKPGGAILMHDCNPQTFESQVIPRITSTWHGDVWKAFVDFRVKSPQVECYVINTDCGCGIIKYNENLKKLPINVDVHYRDLDSDRKSILNLITVDEFHEKFKDIIGRKKMKKEYPDNVVYDNESGEFDAKLKSYPTTVGSQKFEPIVVDKSDSIKANKYFESRLNELKGEYKKLVDEYEWTNLVYKSTYSFQPIPGEPYHLYHNSKTDKLFLSLIEPTQWDKVYIGTFILLNNGKWEKV